MSLKFFNLEDYYNKNADLKKSDIEQLQKWLEKQPHLPPVSEHQLCLFLHSCYYSVERAKETLDNFFSIKTSCPELFGLKDPEKFVPSLDEVLVAPLPTLTPEGHQIMLLKILNCNPNTYSFGNYVKYTSLSIYFCFLENEPPQGLVLILDLKDFTYKHFTNIPLYVVKKAVVFVQEALPVRLKAIHCLNTPSFIETIVAILKSIIKPALLNIIHFHTSGLNNSNQHLVKCLPEDYGGSASSIAVLHETAKDQMLRNLSFIEKLDNELVDESKRLVKIDNITSMFGVEGSFKRLEID